MSTSAIHEARLALCDGLRDRQGLTGVRVSYGPPLPAMPGEFVAVWDAESPDEETEALGNNRRREQFRIQVVVSVRRTGGDMEGCAARAYALMAEVEQFVRDNKRLEATYPATAPQLNWCVFRGITSDELRADDKGREARLYGAVEFSARL